MKGTANKYTTEQLAFVKSNCTLTRSELTKKFNQKYNRSLSTSNMAALCKRNQWFTGRTGQFKNGHIPHPDARPKAPNKTSFKKGSTPANLHPIGHERIDSKAGYILIKVAKKDPHTNAGTCYVAKHREVWEAHNGPIKNGMIVIFIDGDRLNPDIDNLELISKAENLHRNKLGLNQAPDELKSPIRALAKMETVRFQKQNEQRN